MKRKRATNIVITLYLTLLSTTVAYAYGFSFPMTELYALKANMGTITGQTDKALHAYIGLGLFGMITLVSRKPFRSMMPWLIVLALELLNELIDVQNSLSNLGHTFWSNSLSDILYTIVLPSSILIMAKLKHQLMPQRAKPVVNIESSPAFQSLSKAR